MLKTALPKLLIKSLIMTITLFILALPSIKLFNTITAIGLVTAFRSLSFLGSFVVLFILFSIYDLATSHRVWGVENAIAVLLVLLLFASLTFSVLIIVISFVLILFGLVLGASLRQVSLKERGTAEVISGSIAFLFIIWVIYVVLANSNYYTPPTSNSISNYYTSLTSNSVNLNRPYLTQQQALNNCIRQTDSLIRLIYDKLPSSTQISIINTTFFEYPTSAGNILNWGRFWDSDGVATDCTIPGYNYLCNDANQAISLENANRTLVAIGIVIKVDVSASGGRVRDYPLLCDANGNLLNGSKNLPANIS